VSGGVVQASPGGLVGVLGGGALCAFGGGLGLGVGLGGLPGVAGGGEDGFAVRVGSDCGVAAEPGGAVLGGGEALSRRGGLLAQVGQVFGEVAVAAVGVPEGLTLGECP